MGIKTTQNFTLIWNLLSKMQKKANKKVCKIEVCWQITFSMYTFSNYFHGFEISVKFCVFWYSYVKKEIKKIWVMEYIYEYFLEIVECKFARNGLTNWKTFLANILKNIIWHLFAGESHQVVKITVPYCTMRILTRARIKCKLEIYCN